MHEISTPPTDERSLDTLYWILTHPRRRHLVGVVAGRDPPIPLAELAATLVDARRQSGEWSPDDVDEVTASLHHVHLPTLDAAGLVEYDHESNVVTRTRPALNTVART